MCCIINRFRYKLIKILLLDRSVRFGLYIVIVNYLPGAFESLISN